MKDDATLKLSLSSRLQHRDSVCWSSRNSTERFQLRDCEATAPTWTPYIQSLSALAPGALRMRAPCGALGGVCSCGMQIFRSNSPNVMLGLSCAVCLVS